MTVLHVPAANAARSHQVDVTGGMMGVASMGEPVTSQRKAVWSEVQGVM